MARRQRSRRRGPRTTRLLNLTKKKMTRLGLCLSIENLRMLIWLSDSTPACLYLCAVVSPVVQRFTPVRYPWRCPFPKHLPSVGRLEVDVMLLKDSRAHDPDIYPCRARLIHSVQIELALASALSYFVSVKRSSTGRAVSSEDRRLP